jgi:hypothetical protein
MCGEYLGCASALPLNRIELLDGVPRLISDKLNRNSQSDTARKKICSICSYIKIRRNLLHSRCL